MPPARARRLVPSRDGTLLQVHEYGPAAAPTVVLAHGWTCSLDMWAPQIRELATDHRVVAYDQRGHGGSAAPGPAGFSVAALAEDLRAVLDTCSRPDRRAVLVGHSMGAIGAVAYAGMFPDLVDSQVGAAVLISMSVYGIAGGITVDVFGRPRPVWPFVTRRILTNGLPAGRPTALHRWMIRRITFSPTAAPEQVARCTDINFACPPRTRAGWGALLADLDLRASVHALTAPTTVLHGDADRLIPIQDGRAVADALPHLVEMVELPGVGHMSTMQAAPEVNAAIRRAVRTEASGGAGAAAAS